MARQARETFIDIQTSTVIDYPREAWEDATGPFGGAYTWALENMAPNTEVVGVRIEYNQYERPDIFKFRLIRGEGFDVRGKMETSDYKHFTIKAGYLGLVQRADEWVKRWILVDRDGHTEWALDWELIRHNYAYTEHPPFTAHALIGQLASIINDSNKSLAGRNWARESFGMAFKSLRGSRLDFLVKGRSTEAMQYMYRTAMETIREHPEGLTSEAMDELVDLAKRCCLTASSSESSHGR